MQGSRVGVVTIRTGGTWAVRVELAELCGEKEHLSAARGGLSLFASGWEDTFSAVHPSGAFQVMAGWTRGQEKQCGCGGPARHPAVAGAGREGQGGLECCTKGAFPQGTVPHEKPCRVHSHEDLRAGP